MKKYTSHITEINKILIFVFLSLVSSAVFAASDDPTAVQIGNQKLALSQLDKQGEDKIFNSKIDLYKARLKTVSKWIDNTLIQIEAKKHGVSVEKLLDQEVYRSINVSNDMVKAILYGFTDDDIPSDPQVSENIRTHLMEGYKKFRRAEYLQKLRKKYHVKVLLKKPKKTEKHYNPSLDGLINMGPKNAQNTIVYFFDFNCSYCKEADGQLAQLQKLHPDQIHIVLRNARSAITKDERRAEAAAQCAAGQNQFWKYHQALYTMDEDYPKSELIRVARVLNLDMRSFESCLAMRTPEQLKRHEPDDLDSLHIYGTPTYFINGKKHTGALSRKELEGLIHLTSTVTKT